MDYSPPGCSVHGILQGRILQWVAMPVYRDLPNPGIEPVSLMSPALVGRFFTTTAIWEAGYLNGVLLIIKNALGISRMIKVSVSSDKLC